MIVKKLAGACLLLSVAIAMSAEKNDKTKAELEQRYALMKTAMANNDSDAIAGLLAPNFRSEDVLGRAENGERMIREVRSLKKDSTKKSETTLLSVSRKGDTVFVEQKYHMAKAKLDSTGAVQQIELETLSKDKWVKISGVWLVQETVTRQLNYRVAGRLVVHKTHD